MLTHEALESLLTPGISERWAAVQERLHPQLAAFAEQLEQEAQRRFGRVWPMYQVSFKNQRYLNRGSNVRAPIDEYHLAIDRAPRGAGVYLVVSGAERLILVVLQLWGARKADLGQVWDEARVVWQPLIERMNDIRFTLPRRRKEAGSKNENAAASEPAPRTVWLDTYLQSRSTSYLLAGFSYRWDDPQITQPQFAKQLIDDVLELLPLNEAIMEQAEQMEPSAAALLRERRAAYSVSAPPAVETIIGRIRAQGFTFSESLIRAYHLALQTRPLVILPGISGTGKTRLTRLYADAVYGDPATTTENEHYLLVAVQPDWHNARDLLGYYNAITGKFHATPFLRFLQRAAAEPTSPFYVCLDEMNLARPEYYLAPILSALETTDHQIDLGAPGPVVETVTGEQLQNPFRLPLNVALIGTVNVDESTHALSDKLLDRANVIELTTVDLEGFRQSYRGQIDQQAWPVIVDIHAIVSRAGQPFGYRTLAEILRYMEQAQGIMPARQALDQQIKQKILPKLRGEDQPRLRRALTALLELLLGQPQGNWGKAGTIQPDMIDAAPFPDSAEKVRRMLERLDADGFTDFYG